MQELAAVSGGISCNSRTRGMGIILFLVDTSASMNQKTYLGASYLDVAKVAIETFLKV